MPHGDRLYLQSQGWRHEFRRGLLSGLTQESVEIRPKADNLYFCNLKVYDMSHQHMESSMNRRHFLHSAAAAGAGLALSPMASTGAQTVKTDDINVALLGAGLQGQNLMSSCMKMPGIRFRALCDIWTTYNQKRISRMLRAYRHEHNTYTDYREMLAGEKDLDAVIIATPDFRHHQHTIACLKAGLHVYCEAPMSNSIEHAANMVRAARRTGKLLQIGCQRRSDPRYIHCYDKLLRESSVIGRTAAVSGQWNRFVIAPLGWPQRYPLDQSTLEEYGYESMAQFRNWRWYKGLGSGPVVDRGSHQIDVFNWFLDANPRSVMASGHTSYLDKRTHQWYDTVMAVYEYDTFAGPVSAFYQVLSCNSHEGYFEEFIGNQGNLRISQNSNYTMAWPERINSENEPWARCVKAGYLIAPDEIMKVLDKLTVQQLARVLVVDETPPALEPTSLKLPVKTKKPFHQPHLENFFDAIRGKAELNYPADVGYQTAVAVLKINEAIRTGRKLSLAPDQFKV